MAAPREVRRAAIGSPCIFDDVRLKEWRYVFQTRYYRDERRRNLRRVRCYSHDRGDGMRAMWRTTVSAG